MVNPNLPQDILIEIFLQLPVKSVGKCRCLAKSWRNILSSSHFIKSHLNRKPYEQDLILINTSFQTLSIATIKEDATSTKLDLSGNFPSSAIVGCCDGLVLLINYDEDEKLLVNPITLEQVSIPDSPLALKGSSTSIYGFGYDRSSDDYKVVALPYDEDHNQNTFVDVYSMKRGFWKRVENSLYDPETLEVSHGVCVNGAIHWLASKGESIFRYVIAAFSLAHEVFDEIPLPSGVDWDRIPFQRLAAAGGCLCLIISSDSVHSWVTETWIMKEYGCGESWMRMVVNGDYGLEIFKPLCYVGDEEEIVLLTEGGRILERRMVVYSVEEGRSRNMNVDGAAEPMVFVEEDAFLPSLVSPAMLMEL